MTDNPLIVEVQKREKIIDELQERLNTANSIIDRLADHPAAPLELRKLARTYIGVGIVKRGQRARRRAL